MCFANVEKALFVHTCALTSNISNNRKNYLDNTKLLSSYAPALNPAQTTPAVTPKIAYTYTYTVEEPPR